MTNAADAFALESGTTFLNHGSFGACPKVVLAEQARLRAQLESQPVRFFSREVPELLDAARERLATLVGAHARELVFVANATTGVSTVLGSLRLSPGDELLTTNHAYGACKNALDVTAQRTGARVVTAQVPFPLTHDAEVVDAVLRAVTPRTRLALLDHVTSPTALVLPIARLLSELRARGVRTLVDGAHAPGMLALDLHALGADYYTGNLHKWLCAPKSVAFLYVPEPMQEGLHPLTISHGATAPLQGRSRFHAEFDWVGTTDPTPALCVPAAIAFLESQLPGGMPALYAHNRALALAARRELCSALGVEPPCPESMVGSLAAVPLPDGDAPTLHDLLLDRHAIEVPIVAWPAPPSRLVRVSAQLYNRLAQYTALGSVLRELIVTGGHS